MTNTGKVLLSSFLFLAGSTFAVAQTNVFPDDGSVGIGRTNPQGKLHVKKNAQTMVLEGSDHSYISWYPLGLNSGRRAWFGFGQQSPMNITLRNENTDGNIVLMTDGGFVGVNTLQPMAALHVNKNAETMVLEGQGHSYLSLYPWGMNSGRKGWFGFGANFDENLVVSNQTQDGGLILRSNGGVGVNTNNPATDLHVYGNAGSLALEGENHVYMSLFPWGVNSGRKGFIGFGESETTTLTVGNDIDEGSIALKADYVGVGTVNPRSTLHVKGNGPVLSLEGYQHAFIQFFARGWDNNPRSGFFGYGSGQGNALTLANEESFGHIILRPGDEGKVGIGTREPKHMLDVCGTIRGKEVIVEADWCDYVFEEDYKLMSIAELEQYLKENKHLPNIPPASEIENNGLHISAVNQGMMEKIEELTLYLIQQNKRIEALEQELQDLKSDQ